MADKLTFRQRARLAAFLLVFGPATGIALTGAPTDTSASRSPADATITERIKQVRGLQRVGKWRDAATLLNDLAKDGHPIALYHLARAYKNGWGVDLDLDRAKTLFSQAVGFPFTLRGETAYELGRLYQRSAGQHCGRLALEWFLKALEWSYPKAHVQLAKHFEHGIGTEPDIDRALFHYEQAAIQGYPTSTIIYARLLSEGRHGVTPDLSRAGYWAERAIAGLSTKARDGSPSAAKTLGRLYRKGDFVDQDLEQAAEWFRRSATLGDAGGMHELALLMLDGEPQPAQVDEALNWLKLAADAGHGGALTALGRLHLKALYGLQREDAPRYFEKGIDAGHPGAMAELARLLLKGELVPRDPKRAKELARAGADRGHRGSRSLLEQIEQAAKALQQEPDAPLPATQTDRG